jgi:hypothetical protein
MGADGEHSFAAMMDGGKRRNSFCAKKSSEFASLLRVGYGDKFWMMARDLADEFFEVAARGKRGNAKLSRQRFHDGEALAADRTGGT